MSAAGTAAILDGALALSALSNLDAMARGVA